MFRVVILLSAAVVLLSSVLVGLLFIDRFNQGNRNRMEICESENVIRGVLLREHTKKLAHAITQRDRTQRFIDEGRSIPGVTHQEFLQALADRKQDVRDERAIVSQVQLRDCH